ncbi:MAG: flagellar assembly protein T N-terminal domain-containing protein [Syntrophorhabdales bacterium]|nr:flagellar assembly protein T N-terminal domain-containing protein [Syntrophorhabdales bacterium]
MKNKNILKGLWILIISLLIPFYAVYGSSGNVVEVEGFASIIDGRKDQARENALNNAFRRAVEQAVGVMVDSDSMVVNAELLNDRIYSKSTGYIKKYNIINEKVDGDSYRIKINAIVSKVKIEKDIDEIGQIIKKAGNPRIMFLITEQTGNDGKPTYWWGKEGSSGSGTAENVLTSVFLQKGFNLVDRKVVLAGIKDNIKKLDVDVDNDTALRLAALGEADVVVIGKVTANSGRPMMGTSIRSNQVSFTARAVNADTGQPLASYTTNAVQAHVDPVTGTSQAIQKAANDMAERLSYQILGKLKKRASGLHTVKISVSGLKFSDINAFTETLKELESLEELNQRGFTGGALRLDADITVSTKDFADNLNHLRFKKRPIEVTLYTSNAIELKVKTK